MAEVPIILVIDDDPAIQAITSRLLTGAGYRVEVAQTGCEGLAMALERIPDLILVDVVLPDIDGIEVCRRLKAEPALSHSFVVMTSHVRMQSDDQALGLEEGADGYIARPVSNREMLARVKAILRIRRAEERVAHLRHVLRAITNVNQLIIRERDRDRLLKSICDLLVEVRGYHNVWIALLDETGSITQAFATGAGDEIVTLLEHDLAGQLPACGIQALRTEETGIVLDTSTECLKCPLAQYYAGEIALIARLEFSGMVYGLFCAVFPSSGWGDPEELQLFRELSGDIAVALHNLSEEAARKDVEMELQAYSERLETMVEARTQALQEAHEQLVRKERLATLGQLAGGVGHELRNPLGAIKNAVYFLDMVLDKPDVEVQDMLKVLRQEVNTAQNIIDDLLDFARTREPDFDTIDINHIIKETLSRIPIPESTPIKVQLNLGMGIPAIQADPDQLYQILGNIVQNGFQAMPDGGTLVIRTALENPAWVQVSVSDTGSGISAENLNRIFEPLFTTKPKGIGLGLALVRNLVEGHGGTVDVASEVGKGATFTVRLPVMAILPGR